jgi:hypothetical protein
LRRSVATLKRCSSISVSVAHPSCLPRVSRPVSRGRCARTGRDQAIADARYSAPVDRRSMIGARRYVVAGHQRRRDDHVGGRQVGAPGTFHKVARRSSALTPGSWGCGSSGSQKKITMSMSPSAILAPICWSPPSGPDSLYFNVETVGNASSASIPLAIYDAVRDGVIKEPTRILAPGFGAGAVAGYCVMRIDPKSWRSRLT